MATKSRILFLLDFLRQNSDEEHSVTSTDIRNAFEAEGICTFVSWFY